MVRMSQEKGGRYVYLHVFVETVVHDERVTHPNSMWLHRMSRSISIIPIKSVSLNLKSKETYPTSAAQQEEAVSKSNRTN